MLAYRHRPMSSHGAIPWEHVLPPPFPSHWKNGIRSRKNISPFFHRNIACPPCAAITLPQEIRKPPAFPRTECPEAPSSPLHPLFHSPGILEQKSMNSTFPFRIYPTSTKIRLHFIRKKHIENIAFYIYIY